jgi:MFS family permease
MAEEHVNKNWIYTVIPITAIGSGLGVIIQLYILSLHGTVFDVAIAIAAYNLVSIPSSIIWGRLTDRIGKTKMFIVLSVLGTLPSLLIIYFLASVSVLQISYAIFALMATASSPAINILVMGTKRHSSEPKYFSRYSILTIIGSLLALIPGLFISPAQIKFYLEFLLGLNLLALIFAYSLIRETPKRAVSEEKINVVRKSFPLLNTLSSLPNILTGPALIDRIHNTLRRRRTRNIYILFAAISLFSLGANMFNTSYIPYLRSYGISYSNVFLISLLNNLGQLVVYAIVLFFVTWVDLRSYYKTASIVRSMSYFFAIIPIISFTRISFFGLNVMLYFIAGLAIAYWNISSSVLVYDKVRGRETGYYLGLWAAILGLSAVVGSLVSGLISADLGYIWTFTLAILFTVGSMAIFRKGYGK